MQRCSEFAYAMCPYRHICGPQQDAVYMEGSECAKFNEDHAVSYNGVPLPPIPPYLPRKPRDSYPLAAIGAKEALFGDEETG